MADLDLDRPGSFEWWLRSQVDRDDAVGKLARAAAASPLPPLEAIADALDERRVRRAFQAARDEFRGR